MDCLVSTCRQEPGRFAPLHPLECNHMTGCVGFAALYSTNRMESRWGCMGVSASNHPG